MEHIGRIKVLQPSDDLLDNLCVCPHCGRHVLYGNMMMYNGIHSCPVCHESLRNEVELVRQHNYNRYVEKANNHEWEPYRWKEGD